MAKHAATSLVNQTERYSSVRTPDPYNQFIKQKRVSRMDSLKPMVALSKLGETTKNRKVSFSNFTDALVFKTNRTSIAPVCSIPVSTTTANQSSTAAATVNQSPAPNQTNASKWTKVRIVASTVPKFVKPAPIKMDSGAESQIRSDFSQLMAKFGTKE